MRFKEKLFRFIPIYTVTSQNDWCQYQSCRSQFFHFFLVLWLASDVKSKYILNGFSYLEKDEVQESSAPISESVVLKFMDCYTPKDRTLQQIISLQVYAWDLNC